MRDDQLPPPDDLDEPEGPEEPHGTIEPMRLGTLLGWAVAGLVGGWALHVACDRLGVAPPLVSWAQPLALLLLAVILAYVARVTWRSVQVRRERLLPHQAVNRLVLARACAIVGALVGAGYLGYGLSWIGDPAELADDRLWRSLVAAGAGLAAAAAAVVLERACRVRKDDEDA